MGLSNAFGQVAGGPAVGALGNTRGLRAALVAAGLLILPEIGVYLRAAGQTPSPLPVPTDVVVDQPV